MVSNDNFVTIKDEFLEKCRLEFKKKDNKPFREKRNFIIGPNGGGKTRLLEVVSEHSSEIFGAEIDVIHLDFPSLVGKKGVLKKEETPEVDLIEFLRYGTKITLKTFLSYIEKQAPAFIEEFFNEKQPGAKLPVKNTSNALHEINEKLNSFLKLGWSVGWSKNSNSNNDGNNITDYFYNKDTFLEKYDMMSPGERNLFFITLFLAILATHKDNYKNMVILIDEPELHLHFDIVRMFIEIVEETFNGVPVWFASHSVHLLPRYSFDEITYVSNGIIERGGSDLRKKIITSLLGIWESSEELLLDVETGEYLDFVRQCFYDPLSVPISKDDPQFNVFLANLQEIITNSKPVHVLDYGAGNGRFGIMLKNIMQEKGLKNTSIEYHTFYLKGEYKNSFNELFPIGKDYGEKGDEGKIPDSKFDIVLLVNTLHEITINEWQKVFSTIFRSLKPDGYLFFCEAQVLSNGENPNEHGYLVLGKDELEVLFDIAAAISEDDKIVYAQIPKNFLNRVNINIIDATINTLKNNSIEMAKKLSLTEKTKKVDQKNLPEAAPDKESLKNSIKTNETIIQEAASIKNKSRKRAFFSMQYINAELALDMLNRKNNNGQKLVYSENKCGYGASPAGKAVNKDMIMQMIKTANLTNNQTVFYAWVCAVRALPFLFRNGNLNFWEESKHQGYLFAVFNALDYAYHANTADVAAVNTSRTVQNAIRAVDVNNDAFAAPIAAAKASANAVYVAADVRDAASVATSAHAAAIYDMNLKSILINDIQLIADNHNLNSHKEAYGVIWTKFKTTLESLGCEYWFKLYDKIFSSNFKIDEDDLYARLTVPDAIKSKGAAEVANYMKEITQ
jgi:SAM-dependent methyltransferase/ABC-type cobalamin/Fe3+-siderophores transport system ATPase subunit